LEKEDVELQTRFNWLNYTAQWRAILINPTNVRTPQNQGKPNIILDSVRQHNYFTITQGNYIGYMFRL